MVDSNPEEDENAGSERESLSVTRRNLLKLAAAGAAVLGITGQSSGGANPNADDLQLPDELNLEKIFVPGDDQFVLVKEDSGERVLSFDPSVGSFNLQGNSAFNLSQVQMGDTFRLPRTKTKMETLEKVRVGPEETKVLADLTGENIITSLWFATFGEARMGRDAIIRVYTDGSSSPDLEMDVGTLWANHLAVKGTPLLNSTRHMSVGSNWSNRRQTHSAMNFPIPCSDGARIEIQNTHSSKVGYLYSQVTYREGATAPFRLKGSGTNYLARDFVSFP
ncbi:DUF2961 domain-containing protein, partial [Candidatus Bipolaricaulota bacterium]|nr:DUF2961 domain-containing protein [Candidatus Bipolaricaulota bacterium]